MPADEVLITVEQQRRLRDEGYLVVKGAVPEAVVAQGHKLIAEALPKHERRLLVPPELATHPDIVGLFYGGAMPAILEQLMGPFPPVISCQVAVTPGYDDLGGNPGTHVDGGWSGPLPKTADDKRQAGAVRYRRSIRPRRHQETARNSHRSTHIRDPGRAAGHRVPRQR